MKPVFANVFLFFFLKIKQKINHESRAGRITMNRKCRLMMIKHSFLTDVRIACYSRPRAPAAFSQAKQRHSTPLSASRKHRDGVCTSTSPKGSKQGADVGHLLWRILFFFNITNTLQMFRNILVSHVFCILFRKLRDAHSYASTHTKKQKHTQYFTSLQLRWKNNCKFI